MKKGGGRMMRPTSSKVVAALVAILGSAGVLEGAELLDLFAGSGAVSRAALARGAARATLVESDPRTASDLSRGLADLGDRVRVVRADVRRALPAFAKRGERFRVVFADPPYGLGWGEELPALTAAHASIIETGGAFVFERSSREQPADIGVPRDDRAYGETVLSFYWY